MALQPQTVEVPFEGGVDTKTDRKKVIPGKLLALENAVFDGQEIRSRPGAAYLPNGKVTGGSLTTANALAVVGGELLRWDDSGVYGYANASAAPWVQRGDEVDAAPLQYEVEAVAQRPYSCENFDAATLLGVSVYVWTEQEAARRVLRATVLDATTGTRFQDAVEVAADTAGVGVAQILCRVVACGGSLVLLYGIGGSGTTAPLYARTITPANPQTLGAATVVATMKRRTVGGYTFPYEFDALDVTSGTAGAGTTGNLSIIYSDPAGGFTLARYSVAPGGAPTLATPAAVNTIPLVGDVDGYQNLHLSVDAARSRIFLLYYVVGGSRTDVRTFNAATHAVIATNTVDGVGGIRAAFRATVVETSVGVMKAYLEVMTITSTVHPLCVASWNTTGAVTQTATAWVRGLRLGGNAFAYGGRFCVPCLYHNLWLSPFTTEGVQPTFFLLDAVTGRVVMRALTGTAGAPLISTPHLPHGIVPAAGRPAVPVPVRVRAEYEDAGGTVIDFSTVGVSELSVAALPPSDAGRTEINRNLHVGGARPALYDANSWTEDGFHLQPEGVTVTLSGSGTLSAGTYSWVVCYEWVDAQGQLHRSAPSTPVTATATSGQSASIVVPYLHLTAKRDVRLAVYRTTANGIVFYRIVRSGKSAVQPNTLTGNTATVSDVYSDASIQDNELLPYGGAQGGSVGGELWHRPPPGYRYIHKHQSYLFAVPMDDPYTVRYTLPLTTGEGPAWADELVLQVPSAHGKAVALATVDDKLVIVCERAAYVVYGQGPLRDGSQNGYTEPMYITGSVGCADAGSICETPDGVMWAATSGLHLLSRGLETVKLGAPVDLYADAKASPDFARAIQMPATKELRWYMEGGRTLIYSSEWRQWGTWTNQPTLDAVLFNDVVHYADGSGVRYEAPGEHEEVGFPIIIAAETAWLKWAGMQGLQRVWKAYLLFSSEVTVNVSSAVYVDYDDSAPAQVSSTQFPGSLEGGRQVERLRQTLKRQLCTALRFRWEFERESSTGIQGGTVALSSLTLEFGVQRAPSKRKVLKFNGG